MKKVSILKGGGYASSTLSVLLLAALSIKTALESPWLAACLILGMAASIFGMFLRWRSHRLEQREKQQTRMAGGADPRYQEP